MTHARHHRIAHRAPRGPLRNLRNRARPALAAALVILSAGACARRELPQAPVARTLTLTRSAPVGDLSLGQGPDGGFYALYTDSATSSLVLTEVGLDPRGNPPCSPQVGQTTHFERTTDSAESGAITGSHLLIARPGRSDLFYHGLQSDGRGLTKWVHRASADSQWWVEVLPFSGMLLGAVPHTAGDLRLVYQAQQTLYLTRLPSAQEPEVLLRPFDAASRGQSVDSDPNGSFTLYDRLSRRLYLVQPAPDGLALEAVHAGGQIHYARLVDGRHSFLLYDGARATVLALQEGDSPGQYSSYRVTLAEQTTMLYFADLGDSRFYLFDEYDSSAPEDQRHCLAILHGARLPDSGTPPRFRKVVLTRAAHALRACRVVQAGDCLILLCARDSLSLTTVSLSDPTFAPLQSSSE